MSEKTYTVGGTINPSVGFYLTREADTKLLEACRNGAFAYILAPRQSGKSSLMVHTALELQQEGVHYAIIDLTRIGTELDVEQWYFGLLMEVVEQLELELDLADWWEQRTDLGMTDRMTRFFREILSTYPEQRFVIFVDEIDTTISLGFTDDFFAAIRSLYNLRPTQPELERITFVLIGVAQPGDLIRDPGRTPFNIGVRVDLKDFTPEEAAPLAKGLGFSEEQAPQAREVLQRVLDWTGGHPYLTQRLCWVIAQKMTSASRPHWTSGEIERLVQTTFSFAKQSAQDSNLQFVRNMLTVNAKPDSVSVLETYLQILHAWRHVPDEERSLVKSHLKLSGVVRSENGVLRVRNRIYREVFDRAWVREHLPVNWSRRLLTVGIGLILALMFASGLAMPFALVRLNKATSTLKQSTKKLDAAEIARKAAEVARDDEAKQRQSKEREAQAAQHALILAQQNADKAAKDAARAATLLVSAEDRRKQAEAARDAQAKEALALKAQRDSLEKKRRFVLAQSMSLQAQQLRSQEPPRMQLSALLAAKSMQESPTPQTAQLLRNLLVQLPRPLALTKLAHYADSKTAQGAGKYSDPTIAPMFSQGGAYLAGVTSDNSIGVWDTRTGDLIGQIKPNGNLSEMSLSQDGRYLAIADPNEVRVWEVSDKRSVFSRKVSDGSRVLSRKIWKVGVCVCLSLDGKWVALSGYRDQKPDGQYVAEVWKVANTELKPTWEEVSGSVPVTSLGFSPDGHYLAIGYQSGGIRLKDLRTEAECLKEAHASSVRLLTFSRDGRFLASDSDDKTVALWYVNAPKAAPPTPPQNGLKGAGLYAQSPSSQQPGASGKPLDLELTAGPKLNLNARPTSLAFSPDSQFLATADSNSLASVWTSGGSLLARLDEEAPALDVAFRQDDRSLLTVSRNGVRAWDVTDEDRLHPFNLPNYSDSQGELVVGRSPDLWYIAFVGAGNRIHILNLRSGQELNNVRAPAKIGSLAVNSTGEYLAEEEADNSIRIWNLEPEPHIVKQWQRKLPQAVLTFSPDGRYLVTLDNKGHVKETAHVLEWRTGQEVAHLPYEINEFTSFFRGFVFSKGSRYLCFEDEKGTISLREVKSGRRILSLHNKREPFPMFSPDEKYLAIGEYMATEHTHLITIYETSTGLIVSRIKQDVWVVNAFSPDGNYLATTGNEPFIRVWEVRTGHEYARVPVAASTNFLAVGLEFSSDGRYLRMLYSLATSLFPSSDGTNIITQTSLWRTEDVLAAVKSRLLRDLTPEEWNDYVPGEDYPQQHPGKDQNQPSIRRALQTTAH